MRHLSGSIVIPEHAVLILEERLKEREAEGLEIPADWGRTEWATYLLFIVEGFRLKATSLDIRWMEASP